MIEPGAPRALLSWRRIDVELDAPSAPPWEWPPPEPVEPKPRLQIPGDDRLTSTFAAELAHHLRRAGIYVRNGSPVVENVNGTALQAITATQFVTWIERWVVCFRIKGEGESDRSLSVADAAKVLAAHQFLNGLPHVERFNPVRLPALATDGSLKLLPSGYDEESRTVTEFTQSSVALLDRCLRVLQREHFKSTFDCSVILTSRFVFLSGLCKPQCGLQCCQHSTNQRNQTSCNFPFRIGVLIKCSKDCRAHNSGNNNDGNSEDSVK
jgi:hypothetical protein